MSVAQPQKEGIGAIKFNEPYWAPHTSQATSSAAGGCTDNYEPAGFTGGTPPPQVGVATNAGDASRPAPGSYASPGNAAYRSVTGANINP